MKITQKKAEHRVQNAFPETVSHNSKVIFVWGEGGWMNGRIDGWIRMDETKHT